MDTDSQIAQAQDTLQKELRRLAEIAPPAPSDETTPPQQAAQLARLHAAQAALRLAAALLRADDPAAAQALDDELRQLDQQLKAWKRKGQGWFETRMVVKKRIHIDKGDDGTPAIWIEKVPYEPYRYFRWRDADGKTRTHYLGSQQPEEEGNPLLSDSAPSVPPPAEQLWATSDNSDHNPQSAPAPAFAATPPPSGPPARRVQRSKPGSPFTGHAQVVPMISPRNRAGRRPATPSPIAPPQSCTIMG